LFSLSNIHLLLADYTIYSPDIQLVDSEHTLLLRGLDAYQSTLRFLQAFLYVWFVPKLQMRLVMDTHRDAIRVAWHVECMPKWPVLRPTYIDGISYYTVRDGVIVQHLLERVELNSTPLRPPYDALFQQLLTKQPAVGPAVVAVDAL